jgi:3-hydroxybutyryl-CoA dehydrogenase
MTASDLRGAPVLVVGAGIMGAGIGQVAAQAGHAVRLFDTREGAAAQAKTKIAGTLDTLVAKGKLDAGEAARAVARIEPIATLEAAAGVQLVVEAIVENLDAKRTLFRTIEPIVGDQAVLASNTSSISITAIANGLQHPRRLVGMHFFNPVPLMRLVEVVSGLQTDCDVAQAVFELSLAWGKVPVHAKSTPGFIVNRIARPYYAETLALLQERAAGPQVLDRPGHELRGDEHGLRSQLLRQALHAVADPARAGRRRPARAQERAWLLQLSRRTAAASGGGV